MKAGGFGLGKGGPAALDRRRHLAGYGLIALSVWVAWEVVKVPVVERAAPSIALRLAPGSPEALRRGAEAEMGARDVEGAATLADASLARAPFNARALRVRGLAMAQAGQTERAAELLTLAGNWSLRDDPAHAWLTEYGLKRGNFALAFAHADTLVRRRDDIQPQVFKLFVDAIIAEPRALPAVVNLLNAGPPWRVPFIRYLAERDDADAVLLGIALALNRGSGKLSDYESGLIYRSWAGEKRWDAMRMLRVSAVSRGPSLVNNGDFGRPAEDDLLPLAWNFGTAPGLAVEIMESDIPNNPALYVQYDGFGNSGPAEQLLLLNPGRYQLSGKFSFEEGPESNPNLAWTVRCEDTGTLLAEVRPAPDLQKATAARELFRVSLTVPDRNCRAQWLKLETRPRDRRTNTVVWFDDIAVEAIR